MHRSIVLAVPYNRYILRYCDALCGDAGSTSRGVACYAAVRRLAGRSSTAGPVYGQLTADPSAVRGYEELLLVP